MVEKEPGIAFQAEGTAICKSFDSRRKALSLVQEPNATGAEGMEGTEACIVSLVRGRAPPDDAEKAGRCHRSVQLMSSAMGNQSQV